MRGVIGLGRGRGRGGGIRGEEGGFVVGGMRVWGDKGMGWSGDEMSWSKEGSLRRWGGVGVPYEGYLVWSVWCLGRRSGHDGLGVRVSFLWRLSASLAGVEADISRVYLRKGGLVGCLLVSAVWWY